MIIDFAIFEMASNKNLIEDSIEPENEVIVKNPSRDDSFLPVLHSYPINIVLSTVNINTEIEKLRPKLLN